MTSENDEADWGGTTMRASTADGGEVEILGHPDGSTFSVWAPDGEGRMWDLMFAGSSEHEGPEGQAAAAYSEGRSRGMFG